MANAALDQVTTFTIFWCVRVRICVLLFHLPKGLYKDDFLSVPNPIQFNEEFSNIFSPYPSTGSVSDTVDPYKSVF